MRLTDAISLRLLRWVLKRTENRAAYHRERAQVWEEKLVEGKRILLEGEVVLRYKGRL